MTTFNESFLENVERSMDLSRFSGREKKLIVENARRCFKEELEKRLEPKLTTEEFLARLYEVEDFIVFKSRERKNRFKYYRDDRIFTGTLALYRAYLAEEAKLEIV